MFGNPRSDSGVLVTGGAGFIGAVTLRRLVDSGHRVTAVDHGRAPRQIVARRALPEVEWVDGDLHDLDLVELLSGFTHVVHLAGRPGVQSSWGNGFVDHLADNVALTQRLLDAAVRTRPRSVLLASSSSVYGDVPAGLVTEADPLRPLSPYGVSKATVEMLMAAYVERGVRAAAMRFFTVYGRGQRADMALHRIIDAACGGRRFELRGSGRQARDFTHVDDVAAAIDAAVESPLAAGTVLNIGSGRPVDLLTLIATVEDQLGRSVPVTRVPAAHGDPMRTAADTTRAQRVLGWSATTSLDAGVADQIGHQTARPDVRPGVSIAACEREPSPAHSRRVA